MKHIKHRKAMRKAILICGSCMMIALYSGGCSGSFDYHDNQQRQPMNEFFASQYEVRDTQRISRVQQAAGARADSTLSGYHFDKAELNSLGRQKLSLMLDDDDSNNPIVVYLDVPKDDEFKAGRQDSIIAYLKEQGLEEKQVSFKEGPNPASVSPADEGLTRLAKTELGGASAGDGGGASPAGGGGSSMGGGGGMSGK